MKHLTLLVLIPYIFQAALVSATTVEFNATLRHVDSGKNHNKTELLRLALHRSTKRNEWLRAALNGSSPEIEGPTSIIGRDWGEYLVTMSIGTPPVRFTALIDTGDGFTWTHCAPCKTCPKQTHTRMFDPTKSSSYTALRCPSEMCELYYFSNPCRSKQPFGGKCTYNLTYTDGTGSWGDLATETLWSKDNTASVPGVMFGCAHYVHGDQLGSTGTLGLGPGRYGLVSQFNVSAFSYCLPEPGSNRTGGLYVGCGARAPPDALTTPLSISWRGQYYVIQLQEIVVGGARVPIDQTKGAIIDSGATFTRLDKTAFEAVGWELDRQLGLPRITDGDYVLDICYKLPRGGGGIGFPKLVLRFEGADLELPSENYLVIDEDKGIVCLAMLPCLENFQVTTLGNYQQKNMLVVYDLANGKLSFVPNYTQCDEM
ncbi:Eukaryotic aspartyl protease family protein [Striga hermonthica]|uniref:Eukaryotic aspartyl protease family protein n=1 Tax=Striga hermonthica TaxID=68872 RepID=A0A9N7N835_STRHE|nr:Eukaryotic aspartyl protease family protein [Striga hermonthica]